MFAAINQIKNVKIAQNVFEALFASYVQRVGKVSAAHHDAMCTDSAMYKAGGLAWWKNRIRSVASNIAQKDSTVNRFIPASPETEAWGGFLGGERVIYTNAAAKTDTQEMLAARIAQIAA